MFSGIANRAYFGEQQANVITIMEVGVKTPAVSFIPESLTSAVTKISGITNVSPEVYSLVMLNNNPLNLHGITAAFQNFTQETIVKGQGLDALQHPTEQIIIAGQTIAALLNLTVGQTYTLYSVTTGSFSSFVLAGIVKFSSVYDDEVFSTIAWTQFFRPQQNKNDLSLLRIRYNPQLISQNILNTLLTTDYTVHFHLFNQSMAGIPVANIDISVYTAEGVFLSNNFTDSLGNASFRLQLGSYTFIIKNGTSLIDINKTILSNMNILVPIGPPTQPKTFSLQIQVYENNSLITGATIRVRSANGTQFNLKSSPTTPTTTTIITGLSVNYYSLNAVYNTYNTSTSIYLNKSTTINLNLTFPVIVHALNTSRQLINTFSCSFIDLKNNTRIYNYNDCNQSVYLPQSDYNVSVTSTGYKKVFLLYNLSYNTLNHTITAVLGNYTALLTFLGFLNNPFPSISVYYRPINNSVFTAAGLTDSQGQIKLRLDPYSPYVIKFNNSALQLASTFNFSSLFNLNKTLILEQNFTFKITSYLVTKMGSIPINGTQITLLTQDNRSYTNMTNTAGVVDEELTIEKILNITATYNNMTKKIIISTLNTKNLSIYFGPITFFVTARSTTGIPLSQTHIILTSGNLSLDFRTDQLGHLLGTLPTLNITYQDYTGLYTLHQSQPTYTLTVVFKTAFLSFILPQTYFGNYYTYTASFLDFVSTQIQLSDSNGNPLPNTILVLENSTMNYNYSALTDYTGIIANLNLSVGYYNAYIKYNGLFFNQLVKIDSENIIYLTIPIVTTNIVFQIPNRNYLGFSGQQVTTQFLGQSTTFFIEIIAIVLISTIGVLITLLISLVNLIIQDNSQEIKLLAIIGASFNQIIANLLIQFQKLSVLGSLIGLTLGTILATLIPAFQDVQIVGLVIKPQFSFELTLVYFCIMNILVFIFLGVILVSQKWRTITLHES